MIFAVLLLAASALGQESVQQKVPAVQLLMAAETAPHPSFNGISGLAYDAGMQKYWAISDDTRPAIPGDAPNSGRRYFEVSIVFPDGGTVMAPKPEMIFAVPEPEGVSTRPEGLDFAGGFLYFADNEPRSDSAGTGFNSRVRRFSPAASPPAFDDTFEVFFPVPEPFTFAGVSVNTGDSGQHFLYYLVADPFSFDSPDTLILGEIDVNLGNLSRAFSYPLSLSRGVDVLWESGQTLLIMETQVPLQGAGAGSEPSLPSNMNGFGQAARPSKVAIYQVQLPDPTKPSNLDILPGRKERVEEKKGNQGLPTLDKVLLGEFTLAPNAEKPQVQDLVFSPPPGAGNPSRVPASSLSTAFNDVLPFWDGMTFGPEMEGGLRSLILISDNNADQNVPTRYASLSYEPLKPDDYVPM